VVSQIGDGFDHAHSIGGWSVAAQARLGQSAASMKGSASISNGRAFPGDSYYQIARFG
jgi:hypothetical protein